MVTKTDVYVDTSAFIAFLDRSDTYHALFRQLFSNPPPLITTPLVIAEGHGWFLKRYDRTRALQFLAMVDVMSPLQVVTVGLQEQLAAGKLLRKFSDQDLTLADAVGLYMMSEHSSKMCWSTDFHLGLTRIPLIIHQY